MTYSLNGGPPSTTPPTFAVLDTTAIEVAITNDPTGVQVDDGGEQDTDAGGETAPDAEAGPDSGVESDAETLPATGAVNLTLITIGLACVFVGSAILCARRGAFVRATTRRRRS